MPKSIKRTGTEKEIVSAMIRLNTKGERELVNIEDVKRLPVIPQTGARILKKKIGTDLGLKNNLMYEDISAALAVSTKRKFGTTINHSELEMEDSRMISAIDAQEDAVTVFDLVHKGRQKVQENMQMRRDSRIEVHSPKILSPTNMQNRRTTVTNKDLMPSSNTSSVSNLHANKKQSLSLNYRTTRLASKDQKKAIQQLHKEIQSAILPEIASAISYKKKSKSLDGRKKRDISFENVDKEKKVVEYLHEEYMDTHSRGKWTIFNKQAIEVVEVDSEEEGLAKIKEEEIIEQIMTQDQSSLNTLPDSVWALLYEAKCLDLAIPSKSDKQQLRFMT